MKSIQALVPLCVLLWVAVGCAASTAAPRGAMEELLRWGVEERGVVLGENVVLAEGDFGVGLHATGRVDPPRDGRPAASAVLAVPLSLAFTEAKARAALIARGDDTVMVAGSGDGALERTLILGLLAERERGTLSEWAACVFAPTSAAVSALCTADTTLWLACCAYTPCNTRQIDVRLPAVYCACDVLGGAGTCVTPAWTRSKRRRVREQGGYECAPSYPSLAPNSTLRPSRSVYRSR